MSSPRRIASLVAASVTAVVAGLTGAAPAEASSADGQQGELRNAGTGLCLDWPGSLGQGTTFVVTATCTGSKTQQWTYSEADHLIRNTGTDYCAITANTNAVFVSLCQTDRWGEHWGYTSDGRFHQLDWTVGCLQDDKSWSYVSWTGVCHNTDIEVWRHPAA